MKQIAISAIGLLILSLGIYSCNKEELKSNGVLVKKTLQIPIGQINGILFKGPKCLKFGLGCLQSPNSVEYIDAAEVFELNSNQIKLVITRQNGMFSEPEFEVESISLNSLLNNLNQPTFSQDYNIIGGIYQVTFINNSTAEVILNYNL